MPIANMLSITSNPFLSMLIWIALLLAALYFARRPFHRAVGSLCKIIHNAMRLIAASLLSGEKRLARHNREVLIAAGLEKAERLVEREFGRTLKEQHKSAIDNYRNSNAQRHSILNKMLPVWRRVQKGLNNVDRSIENLNRRAKKIDRTMDEYEQIRLQTDKAARMLSSSSLAQFGISGSFLIVAFGAALINFNLIAMPMSSIFGIASYIGPYKTSDIATLFIILIQLTIGFFFDGITQDYPTVSGHRKYG